MSESSSPYILLFLRPLRARCPHTMRVLYAPLSVTGFSTLQLELSGAHDHRVIFRISEERCVTYARMNSNLWAISNLS